MAVSIEPNVHKRKIIRDVFSIGFHPGLKALGRTRGAVGLTSYKPHSTRPPQNAGVKVKSQRGAKRCPAVLWSQITFVSRNKTNNCARDVEFVVCGLWFVVAVAGMEYWM